MSNSVQILWERFLTKKPYFIAEAGVNHEGDLELAKKLIISAKNSGADAIKFQSYKASTLTTKNAPRFWDYDKEIIKNGSQFDSYSALDSFGEKEHLKLKQICDEHNIEFFSTPFDFESIEYLEKIDVRMHKVASCDITNFPLLKKLSKTNKIILESKTFLVILGFPRPKVARKGDFLLVDKNNRICNYCHNVTSV